MVLSMDFNEGILDISLKRRRNNEKQPIGATFSGKIDDDANILNISYSFEQNTMMRKLPKKD